MDKSAFHKLSYGIYVLTTELEGVPFGCIINTAFQITSEPPRLAISCNKDNYTHDKITEAKIFGLSVLNEQSSQELIGTFGYNSGRDINKFDNHSFNIGKILSTPLFSTESVATFELKVVDSMDVGTHTIFIGEIIESSVENPSTNEMTYKYFHDVRKAKAPKNAPTYVEQDVKPNSYECSVCKYVYDKEIDFNDLSDDWVCPICGASKNAFENI